METENKLYDEPRKGWGLEEGRGAGSAYEKEKKKKSFKKQKKRHVVSK